MLSDLRLPEEILIQDGCKEVYIFGSIGVTTPKLKNSTLSFLYRTSVLNW